MLMNYVFAWKSAFKIHVNCFMAGGYDSPWASSVQFSHPVVSDSLGPRGLQHARSPCPSPTPGAYSNSCPSSWWCHPTISSSVVPFSSCLQSFAASGSLPMSQFFASRGQSIGASASASVRLSGECVTSLILSHHNKKLKRQMLKPSACHNSRTML